jgi:hypothetical protein
MDRAKLELPPTENLRPIAKKVILSSSQLRPDHLLLKTAPPGSWIFL